MYWLFMLSIILLSPIVAIAHEGAHPPLSPFVQQQVHKYEKFYKQEICFNFGCDKAPQFFAQIHQESRWKETAASKYASGLAQFTPDTAKWIHQLYAKDLKETCANTDGCPLDAKWAMRSLVLYMKRLHNGYGFAGTQDDRMAFSLAAYNGGAGWIPKERKKAIESGFSDTLWFGGVELTCVRADWACKENRQYPKVILFEWRHVYGDFFSRR